MLALLDQTHEPIVANEAEAIIARKAADRLKAVAETHQNINITVDGKEDAKITVPLPARAVMLVYQVLEAMANRTPMSIIPHEAALTTQQAADYLNISRPFLIKQLEAGKLAYRKIGSHRRVRFADLIDYEFKCREEQKKAMAILNDEAKKLGFVDK